MKKIEIKEENLGKCIKERRQEMGLTLKQLSDMVGISPSYLSKIETEQRTAPSWEVIVNIQKALQMRNGLTSIENINKAESENIKTRLSELCELIEMYARRKDASFKEIMGILAMIEDIIYNNNLI